MNRLFHAKIQAGSWVLVAALFAVAIFSMWRVSGWMLAVSLLLLVVVIERMIHTTYTVTASGELIIHKGRFSKDRIISLADIRQIDRVLGARLFGKSYSSSLVIVCNNGEQITVLPDREDDFVKCIAKRRTPHEAE